MNRECEEVRIAVCDDLAGDREFLTAALKEYEALHRYRFAIEEFTSGEALLAVDTDNYDLIFLDIFMGEKNGMEVAGELVKRSGKAALVFCSTSAEFAVQSYEVNALHYLLKPYTKEKLSGVLDRFFRAYKSQRNILVKVGRSEEMIYLQDILYVEANNKKSVIHTKNGDVEASVSMGQLMEMLPEGEFVRPIRYALVSMAEVVSVPTDVMKLSDGTEVPVSRGEKQNMKDAFADYRWKHSVIRR